MHSSILSVVTVVLNDPVGLARTGESVLKQTLRPEWIIVDGGSTSSTIDILHRFGSFAHWISGRDNGIYDAMNKGVRMCSGEFVVFLNAGDCFSDSEVVADVCSFLSSQERELADVLCCGANLILADGRKVYRPPKIVDDYIWHGLPANHQATYYRRSVLGDKPYDLSYKMCGDYFIAADLYVRNAPFLYLNRPVVEFYLDGVSFSWRRELFMEPYVIQQKILSHGLGWRILSLVKRLISGAVLRLLSLPLLGEWVFKVYSYCRPIR
jgi:putative colanic acid biosynthesis glycosyltransferase